MYKVPDKGKLNAFVPVRVPKVRDVFKRRGFLRSVESRSNPLEIMSRNPLEIQDHVTKQFDQHVYEEYSRQQAEIEKQQQQQQQQQQYEENSEPKQE